MPRLKLSTYNTYQEQEGQDPLLDEVLAGRDSFAFLQEVSPRRALWILETFRDRAFVSLARHGLQYLATVLPEKTRFIESSTVQLNGYAGVVPAAWSLRRGCGLYKARNRFWKDCFEPRVAQIGRVSWQGLEFQVVNAHLSLEPGLRNRSFSRLAKSIVGGDVVVAGDLNTTAEDLFLNDFVLSGRLRIAGTDEATHNSGRRIDYVLYKGGFGEVGYSMRKGCSDHRLLRIDLEV